MKTSPKPIIITFSTSPPKTTKTNRNSFRSKDRIVTRSRIWKTKWKLSWPSCPIPGSKKIHSKRKIKPCPKKSWIYRTIWDKWYLVSLIPQPTFQFPMNLLLKYQSFTNAHVWISFLTSFLTKNWPSKESSTFIQSLSLKLKTSWQNTSSQLYQVSKKQAVLTLLKDRSWMFWEKPIKPLTKRSSKRFTILESLPK